MRAWILTCGLCACSVGDRYVVQPDTLAALRALSLAQREHTAAPVRRVRDGDAADVRASAFALAESSPRSDGSIEVPTRMPSHRLVVANALVWTGTPPSIAGLLMIIFGRGAVRWSGIALAAAAEPVMISGTVLWVKEANAHPQELPRGLADVTYLPDPTQPVSWR